MSRSSLLRVAASVALLLAFAAGGLSGFCPMASMAAAAAGAGGDHGCCQAGISGEPPPCCHAGMETSPATTGKIVSVAPAAVAAWSGHHSLPSAPELPALAPEARRLHTHGPPLVLRI